MISRLFPRSRKAGEPTGAVPEGQRIYAIGDIHGEINLLDTLWDKIEADDRSRPASNTCIIFLGDLIDRGPNSAQVVERALEVAQRRGNVRFLLGNHEEVFLKSMVGDLKALAFFLRIGGRETILSYGIPEDEYRSSDYPALLALMKAKIPAKHIAFLERFEDLIIVGDYAFVHAGVRPSLPLARQRPGDLRWIREEFLSFSGNLEKLIVHGHTITEEVELRPHRIGLDTGAYASGKLSAMGFEGKERWVLQASARDVIQC